MIPLLLLAGWAGAASPRSLPSAPPAAPVVPALPVLPALAAPTLTPTAAAAEASVAASAQLERVAEAAAPRDGGPAEPASLGAAYDGAAAPAEAAAGAVPEFSAMPVAAQLAASGWYGGRASVTPWAARGRQPWLGFYADLYAALAAQAPAGYRDETPAGPAFHLGGHDVVQAILGLPRSVPDAEVNLYGRFDGIEQHLDLWSSVDAGREIAVNPESTGSLQRMVERRAREGAAADALDQVQDNVLLKWNLLSLTPAGLEIRPLDSASREDLEGRRLRLSTRRGLLSPYELHYDLIVAYRALEEARPPWRLDPDTRRLISRSLAALSAEERESVLQRAGQTLPGLRAFVSRRFGP
jgi:hypothetical protein